MPPCPIAAGHTSGSITTPALPTKSPLPGKIGATGSVTVKGGSDALDMTLDVELS